MTEQIRYSPDSTISVVDDGDGNFRFVRQEDADTLPVGRDLTAAEIDSLDD